MAKQIHQEMGTVYLRGMEAPPIGNPDYLYRTVTHSDLEAACAEGWEVVSSFQDTVISIETDDVPNPDFLPPSRDSYGGYTSSMGLPILSLRKSVPTTCTYFFLRRPKNELLSSLQAEIIQLKDKEAQLTRKLEDMTRSSQTLLEHLEVLKTELEAVEPSMQKLKEDLAKERVVQTKMVKFMAELWTEVGNNSMRTFLGARYAPELDMITGYSDRSEALFQILMEES